eukprot:14834_1
MYDFNLNLYRVFECSGCLPLIDALQDLKIQKMDKIKIVDQFENVNKDNGLFNKPRKLTRLKCIYEPKKCQAQLKNVYHDDPIICKGCGMKIKKDSDWELHKFHGNDENTEDCGQYCHDVYVNPYPQLKDDVDPVTYSSTFQEIIKQFGLTCSAQNFEFTFIHLHYMTGTESRDCKIKTFALEIIAKLLEEDIIHETISTNNIE